MGQRSTKDNKNIYFETRDNLKLSRNTASEMLEFISASRIEKIETGKVMPHPDEVLAMARCYHNPSLCNYYCSNECQIGQVYVPELKVKDLSQITLEMLNTLNFLTKEKGRLIEIVVDGEISDDERSDFEQIQEMLDQMSIAIDSLKLWCEHTITSEF